MLLMSERGREREDPSPEGKGRREGVDWSFRNLGSATP